MKSKDTEPKQLPLRMLGDLNASSSTQRVVKVSEAATTAPAKANAVDRSIYAEIAEGYFRDAK